jgi:hypothetical protein
VKYFFWIFDIFLVLLASFAIGTLSLNPELVFAQKLNAFFESGNISDIVVLYCGVFIIYGVGLVGRLIYLNCWSTT